MDLKELLREQRDEITAHVIYQNLAGSISDKKNAKVLERISRDELRHYQLLQKRTGVEVKPDRFRIILFTLISRLLGLTFGVKLLERDEEGAQKGYLLQSEQDKVFKKVLEDEERHENELIAMIDEERLRYMGSVVLGLNDALVELTGALAGYTFAFQNTRLIALTGLITGISATLSMAASEYLSTQQDEGEDAGKSALYTGIAYVFTVCALVAPYFLLSNPFAALACTLLAALLIIFVFNFYISVAKGTEFKKRFFGMAAISMGVAAISFGIGVLVKLVLGVDV